MNYSNKRFSKFILAPLLALLVIISNQPFFVYGLGVSSIFANSALAQMPNGIFDYISAFKQELEKIGQISTEEFAKRYDANGNYLKGISWDPTTAKYWDLFNVAPEDNNKNPNRKNYRTLDFRLNPEELAVFKKNGFVVSERLGEESFGEMFYHIYSNDLPVFVSADSILHAWHMSYDAMLKELEEEVLSPSLEEILQNMAEKIPIGAREYGNGELESSLKDVDYFLAVARSLLKSNPANKIQDKGLQESNQEKSTESDITDEPVKTYLNQDDRVAETLAFIKAERLQGFKLFGRERQVDFSQFKPRGHYENSEQLRKYFQAMMWCGTIDIRIAGKPKEASPRELGAAIIFHDLLKKSGKFELWQQFDEILHTFVGQTDSMTFAQLSALLEQAKIKSPADINNLSSLEQLQTDILANKFGIQNIRGHYYVSFSKESPQLPRSFTILGQKFVLDSWVMSQVSDMSKIWDGGNVYRYIPTGLDVAFAVLGNNQIVQNLVQRISNLKKSQPKLALNYQHNLAAVRNVIDRQDSSAWKDNIYMNWLATLRELSTSTSDSKYPEAMQTQSWAMKTLNTQLASWTQLRHDTILYAKQSYGMTIACEYPAGFVEPRPEFWERFEQMVRLTAEQLKKTPTKFSQFQTEQTKFLEQFAKKLAILKNIAVKELGQKPLTDAETDFLKDIVEIVRGGSGSPTYRGWYPSLFYGSRRDSVEWDALVADVHTSIADQEPNIVLHEGVGNVDLLMLAVDNGKDHMVFAGPVLSHYEFQVPNIERKSDSEWQKDIKEGNVPLRPNWTEDYLVSPPTVKTKTPQDKKTKALLLHEEALHLYEQGEFGEALKKFEQVLAITKEINDITWEGKIFRNIAKTYQDAEQYQKALDFYRQALPIYQKLGDRAVEAIILHNMGLIYQNTAQYALARKSYQDSLYASEISSNDVTQGRTHGNIWALESNLGHNRQAQQALEFYQQALKISREIGDRKGQIPVIHNIGTVYSQLGQYQQALESYQQALDISRELKDYEGIVNIFNSIGSVYTKQGKYQQALHLFQQALNISHDSGSHNGEGLTLYNIGTVHSTQEQYHKALSFYQQALVHFQKTGSRDNQGATLYQIGYSFFKLGKLKDAKETLYKAIKVSESIREPLTDRDKVSIFDNHVLPYQTLQEVLISLKHPEEALLIAERGRTRALVELLLRHIYKKPEEPLTPPSPTLAEIQQIAAQQNATLIEYSIVSNQQIYIWVIPPKGEIKFRVVPLPKEISLLNLVKVTRDSIGVRGSNNNNSTTQEDNPSNHLQQLQQLLIKPIADLLPQNQQQRVIFIPHQELFLVPFAALQDEDDKYLIEKYIILTAPSIQALSLTQIDKQAQKNLNTSVLPRGEEVLIVGNPTMPKIEVGKKLKPLPQLDGAEREAKKIANMLGTTAITGDRATESAIVQKMASAKLIHLATHGLLDDIKTIGSPGAIALTPDPLPPSVLSYQEGMKGESGNKRGDGFLTTSEIMEHFGLPEKLPLQAELVVLSACDTGRGDIKGEGVVGLSRAFMASGVPTLVVSLWKVPDDDTVKLMTEFYTNLERKFDKATAMRQAMLTMLKDGDGDPDPKAWAAFTVIGQAE